MGSLVSVVWRNINSLVSLQTPCHGFSPFQFYSTGLLTDTRQRSFGRSLDLWECRSWFWCSLRLVLYACCFFFSLSEVADGIQMLRRSAHSLLLNQVFVACALFPEDYMRSVQVVATSVKVNLVRESSITTPGGPCATPNTQT